MSMPITHCAISKAAHGDECAFKFLVEAREYNETCGAYSVFPCKCKPPCPRPTERQLTTLFTRMNEALELRLKSKNKAHEHPRNRKPAKKVV